MKALLQSIFFSPTPSASSTPKKQSLQQKTLAQRELLRVDKKEKTVYCRTTSRRRGWDSNPCGLESPRALKCDAINWAMIRADFISYLNSEGYSDGYKGDLLRYLDKYFTALSSPADIMRLFAKVEKGKRHLWLGFRTIFNFLEATGYDAETLTIYRKALPTFRCGIDLKVPEEAGIQKALKHTCERSPRV